MARHLCIHGHFYQPPRENPWTETVEAQESAHPHRDWNARLTAECYAPNAAARLYDGEGRIAGIVNNYASMSFNFGPTLLAWMERRAPAVYAAVLAADRAGRARLGGHGGAIAQAYNHVILPLASRRDKETQVVWGLRDFAHRFGRPAAGMWLPETAVDLESLDLMAAHGVAFTILEPHQARRVRPLAPAGRHWREVGGGAIDPTRPYQVKLPSGRRIAVFFYDGPLARGVAFERLLANGDAFAARLLAAAPAGGGAAGDPGNVGDSGNDRLINVATDGETYGHHHRFGEMALAYALRQVEASGGATLTNYAAYLAAHPPAEQVEIVEQSSWSCVHGVDRWREDCGCRIGGQPGWNQAWRAPLRHALDELRDEIAPRWEEAAGDLFAAPWQARDDYVAVLLDRSPESVDGFLARHAAGPVPHGPRRARALALMEVQRHAMLMYTSCGWFFDDLAGIEAVQVLRYAARAAQLADDLCGGHAERTLLRRLAWARSNDPRAGTGRDIYQARVLPSRVTPRQVAAHYAVRSMFGALPEPARIQGHAVVREEALERGGRRAPSDAPEAAAHVARDRAAAIARNGSAARLAAGRLHVAAPATGEVESFAFAALRQAGGPHVSAGVRRLAAGAAGSDADERPIEPEAFAAAAAEIAAAFDDGDLAQVVRLLDRHLGGAPHGLAALPAGARRRLLAEQEAAAAAEVVECLRAHLARQAPWRRRLADPIDSAGPAQPAHHAHSAHTADLAPPQAPALAAAHRLVLDADLRRELQTGGAEPRRLRRLLDQAAAAGIHLDPGLGLLLAAALVAALERVRAHPDDLTALAHAAELAELARAAPLAVDLWQAQNLCHELREAALACPERPPGAAPAAAADPAVKAPGRLDLFRRLAESLSIAVPAPAAAPAAPPHAPSAIE